MVYVRPKLEYNNPNWSLYLKIDINQLESVQRRYTRLICNHCNIAKRFTSKDYSNLILNLWNIDDLNLILFSLFKMVNGETTINFEKFYKFYKKTTY